MPASTTAGIHSAWRAGGLRSTARAHHPRAGLGRHGAAAGSGAGAVLGVGRDEQARPLHRAGARSCRYSTFLLALDGAEKRGLPGGTSTSSSSGSAPCCQYRQIAGTKKEPRGAFLFFSTARLPEDDLERETRLELATPTLARLCSTN